MIEKIKAFFIYLYNQLVKADDSPHRLALGFGVGVFLGILPLTGPIASLVVAAVFRINKAAALLGSVVTNTWLSFVTFMISLKIGSSILGRDWQVILERCRDLMQHFDWKVFLDVSMQDIALPLFIGYLITGFFSGVIGYFLARLLLRMKRTQA